MSRLFLGLIFLGGVLFSSAVQAKVRVVATIGPLALLVRDVGGDRVEVDTLLPPGASVHLWEMRPRDLFKIKEADLVLAVGCGVDGWLRYRGEKLFSVCEALGKKGSNPHVWISFELVKDTAERLVFRLSEIDPEGKSYFMKRAEGFVKKLNLMKERYAPLFNGMCVVSHHGAWDYLFGELGVVFLGALEPAPHKEPGPGKLLELVNRLSRCNCRVVVSEFGHNRRMAEVVAKESGACMAVLYPLGKGEEESFAEFLRENIEELAKCRATCIR